MNENKIKLVGKLLAIKLDLKYEGYDFINKYIVAFNFTNKEGFKRCYSTKYSWVLSYCNYTSSDIMKVLFNC